MQKTEAVPLTLVRQHEAVSAIVLGEGADLRTIAESFVRTVKRATGAEIPIFNSSAEAAALPAGTVRIHLGPSAEAAALGLNIDALPEEGYHLLSQEGALFVLGRDQTRPDESTIVSQPTRWALNRLLEEQLGVRWLWPGDLGTYVPKSAGFVIPGTDVTYQPTLLQRRIRISLNPSSPFSNEGEALERRLRQEARDWAEDHQQGRRGDIAFGHAFQGWWERYSETRPDYFAVPPEGVTQPHFNRPGWVKLRLSNPDVIEQIAVEYQQADSPEYYNVCPNDGAGFDLSKATLAWDIPANQKRDDIWRARGNLTARYVKFWNLLYDRLKEINPDVKLATYAYHSYKTPPPPQRPLTARAVIGIVPGYKDYALWEGWAKQQGVEAMFLRPNWGHIGANAPYLPLQETADYMRFTWEHSMKGFDVDSLLGFWSTQGTIYYTWARLMTRPDLTADAILDEYTAAFGPGAPKIKAYFAYWQKRTREFAYVDDYAAADKEAQNGKYMKLLREGKTTSSFVLGPRYAMPHLYTDAVLRPAYALLDDAEALIGGTDAEAIARVQFLRDGLREMEATRDAIAISRTINEKTPKPLRQAFEEKSDALERLRTELTPRHVIWGSRITGYEDRRNVDMRPRNMKLPPLNLDGQ